MDYNTFMENHEARQEELNKVIESAQKTIYTKEGQEFKSKNQEAFDEIWAMIQEMQ